MAGGHEPYDDPKLKGISRYFNSQTVRGRANTSMVTFGLLTLYAIYRYTKKKDPPPAPKKKKKTKIVTDGMAGDSVDESQLKGMSKYFNSQTTRGRANVAKATYAVCGALILYFTLKPKSKK